MANHKKEAKINCICKHCGKTFEVNHLMDSIERRNPSMVPYSAKSSSSSMHCSCGSFDFRLNYGWGG